MLSRRGLFGGLFAMLAMPAIIRTPHILMPVKPLIIPTNTWNRYGRRINPAWINWRNRQHWGYDWVSHTQDGGFNLGSFPDPEPRKWL